MRVPVTFLLVLSAVSVLSAAQITPPPTSTVSPDRIEVRASATPLPDVLDRIARQTGMKVTYEGGTPRTRVTANLASVTPAQAVVSLMEGLGLNYLMGLDATSTRVETLLVVSPGSGSGSRPSTPVRSGMAPRPSPAEEMPDEGDASEEDPMAGAIMEAAPVDPNDPMGLGGTPPAGPEGATPGDQKPPPQPFQTPAGIGWSAPPAFPVPPPGAPGATNPAAQPVPGATPPPPNR